MPELRWNPLLATWTMIATNRQNRPHLPLNGSPFAPGQGNMPAAYEVLAYPNDFPVMAQGDFALSEQTAVHPFFVNAEAYGKCEVILYSSDEKKNIYELSDAHLFKLVELWEARFAALEKDKRIKYIYEFENRGEEVGVTIHHPHGQLYAYSWVPQKIKIELDNCKNYFLQNKRNLFDEMNQAEATYTKRIILENDSFLCYIPYFTDYPFGVFIVMKSDKVNFTQFTTAEKNDLVFILKKLTAAFDKIYDRLFPYVMAIHQSPVNMEEYADCQDYYRFHIEFYPPLRAKDKLKWYAGSELGAGAAANPLDTDMCAEILKKCIAI